MSLYTWPGLQLFACISKRREPVRVQTFCSQLVVERCDETVVGRLARLGEIPGGVVGLGTEIESSETDSVPYSIQVAWGY